MEETPLTPREKTEELAYRIYLQENKPSDRAADHWLRAESALSRIDEPAPVPRSDETLPNLLVGATLFCLGQPAIRGLVMISRERLQNGGKFYPSSLQEAQLPLELPATLRLDETSEGFRLVRLQFSTDGGDNFDISIQE